MKLVTQDRRVLFALSSHVEAEALPLGRALSFWKAERVGEGIDCVLTGVGKANAAGAVARVIDPAVHCGVISLGIGGALPGSGLMARDVVVGSASEFSDEGVQTPGGFEGMEHFGFAPAVEGNEVVGDAGWIEAAQSAGARVGRIATVSTCAGTDALAREIARRSGALVEAMEGAAVGLVAARLRLRFCEIRVVSNTTGDRERQRWDLSGALGQLRQVFSELTG